MSEYELRDLFVSMQGEAQTTSALLLSVISSYLVVSYLIDSNLTKSQSGIFTGIFIAMPMYFWNAIFLFIHCSIAGACLKFMWDIRHPNSK